MKMKNINIPLEKISTLCEKWEIVELSFFGSILREDFNLKNSDIDILVSFKPHSRISWNIIELKEELELLLKRKVDLVSKKSIENSRNPYRRDEILNSYQVIYEQAA